MGTQWPRPQQSRSGPHREGRRHPKAWSCNVPSRRLTNRSTGHATAWHPGRAAALVIIGRTARAPRRCVPVNSALGGATHLQCTPLLLPSPSAQRSDGPRDASPLCAEIRTATVSDRLITFQSREGVATHERIYIGPQPS